ncbi:MAG TPA: GNAT family N-acetyltransferase, partial [Caulobacteraceae bacterium]|nr:GNAT family N-acetyltransferase [Caulobacteraceae bacterium]
MEIETPRLLLRPTIAADLKDLHGLEQDPEVMRYLNGGRPTPLEPDADRGFLMPRGCDVGVWTVIERATGGFLGWVSVVPEADGGELGYRFRREHWGRGFATEAAGAVIADAF